ncbi:endonuclease/exonuclease/phosphatase family protein [Luteolibacter pohnpeiensis]|uniref:Endonuclease/exonuclease/phosphatase family protein n=1 Tax=Luteolibacter pohnpeiensis TaxID=454153 RepID=A0A934VXC6_9BACT|nr:endonuclease/exonuclease/phosphatase family protein [Luteolibacter pohnpeiensis]MBK1884225.1 endonuclease/exonuclease/phosphatase family protein [Luteolibacter pohnpeiensis]
MLRSLLVMCCAYFAHAGLVSAQDSQSTLKVLSFNLRYLNPGDTGIHSWEVRRDLVANVIKKNAPDVLGIQEGLRPMLDDLDNRLSGYAEVGCGRADGKTEGEASAIFVRTDRFTIQESGTFWLSDTPDVVGSKSWGNRVVRICTWVRLLDRQAGKFFYFFNTHLDHEAQLARENGIKLILQRIADCKFPGPFILTGDFNAEPENPIHQIIRENPLAPFDVWKTLNPDTPESESGTFHGFEGNTDGNRIDYIYASNDIEGLQSAILHDSENGIYPSDHYPVSAILKFKAEN